MTSVLTIHKSQGLKLTMATIGIEKTKHQGVTFRIISWTISLVSLQISPTISFTCYTKMKDNSCPSPKEKRGMPRCFIIMTHNNSTCSYPPHPKKKKDMHYHRWIQMSWTLILLHYALKHISKKAMFLDTHFKHIFTFTNNHLSIK